MTRRRRLLVGCLSLALCACTESTADKPKATQKAPKMMMRDLDIVSLRQGFGAPSSNAGMPIGDAVRLMDEFKTADEFVALPAAGTEELWFGWSYNVANDASSGEGFAFFRLWAGPRATRIMNQGGLDDASLLDASGFASGLDTDGITEVDDADEVAKSLKRGSPVRQTSKALRYMRTTKPEHGYFAIGRTDGKSKVIPEANPRFFRKKGNRMLMLQPVPSKSGLAGHYAELWKVPPAPTPK